MILASGWGSPSQARRILSGGRSLGRGARSQEDKPRRLYRLPPDSPGLDEPEASQVVGLPLQGGGGRRAERRGQGRSVQVRARSFAAINGCGRWIACDVLWTAQAKSPLVSGVTRRDRPHCLAIKASPPVSRGRPSTCVGTARRRPTNFSTAPCWCTCTSAVHGRVHGERARLAEEVGITR